MNADPEALSGWTWRRWVLFSVLVFLGQMAAISWLSRVPPVRAPGEGVEAPVQLLSSSNGSRHAARVLETADPTLFALVSEQGFSGSAWLQVPRLEYGMTNRVEPVQCLDLPVEDLAADFAEYVQTNLLFDEFALDQLNPALARPSLPEAVVVPSTAVRLEGGLSSRPLLPRQRWPKLSEPILTNNTVIQVLVNEDGLTLSAAVLASSGVSKADRDALTFSAGARFAPVAAGTGMVFETLVFQWAGVQWTGGGAPMPQVFTP